MNAIITSTFAATAWNFLGFTWIWMGFITGWKDDLGGGGGGEDGTS